MRLEFEWDATKAAENTKTHGVAFDEALTVRVRCARAIGGVILVMRAI